MARWDNNSEKDEFLRKVRTGELKIDPQRARIQMFLHKAGECDLYRINFFVTAESYHGPVARIEHESIPGWPIWIVMEDETSFPLNVYCTEEGPPYQYREKGEVSMDDEYEVWSLRVQSMNAVTGQTDED